MENIETTSPPGKLVFHLFAALAEFERNVARERILAGLRSALARGRTGGRPKKPTRKEGLDMLRALVKEGNTQAKDIAARSGISRPPSTGWRHPTVNPDAPVKSIRKALNLHNALDSWRIHGE